MKQLLGSFALKIYDNLFLVKHQIRGELRVGICVSDKDIGL